MNLFAGFYFSDVRQFFQYEPPPKDVVDFQERCQKRLVLKKKRAEEAQIDLTSEQMETMRMQQEEEARIKFESLKL